MCVHCFMHMEYSNFCPCCAEKQETMFKAWKVAAPILSTKNMIELAIQLAKHDVDIRIINDKKMYDVYIREASPNNICEPTVMRTLTQSTIPPNEGEATATAPIKSPEVNK